MNTPDDALREAAKDVLADWYTLASNLPQMDSVEALEFGAMQKLRLALAASKPEQQAQAVEPKVVAYAGNNGEIFPTIYGYSVLRVNDDLITLAAHREAIAKAHSDLRKANSNHEEFERRWYLAEDAIAKKDAALKACVDGTKRWVVVRESVLDVGFGDDVRTGGKPELGYALIPKLGTFGSDEEASKAIRSLGLPLGWVYMPLSRLIPDIDTAITQAEGAMK